MTHPSDSQLFLCSFLAPFVFATLAPVLFEINVIEHLVNRVEVLAGQPWLTSAMYALFVLGPSYGCLVALQKPWRQRFMFICGFSISLVGYVPALFFYGLVVSCLLLRNCL